MLAPPQKPRFIIQTGDCRELLKIYPEKSVNCCVTSPPYFGLRDYGHAGQIGLEKTPDQYVAELVAVFREVKRVLRDDGTLWLNLGDSYCTSPKGNPGVRGNINGGKRDGAESETVPGAFNKSKLPGLKPKDLIGIPWRVAFALQADGWYLRQDIIWHKPNPMPESVTDRCTKAHEYIFMFAKSGKPTIWKAKDTQEWSSMPDLAERLLPADEEESVPRWRGYDYYYDQEAVAEPVAASTIERISQANLLNQKGSTRVPGKTNGNMKAVIKKQDGHGRRHAGFNERYFEQTQAPPTRNRRSVWTVTTKPFKQAHFATFPPDLIEPCILAGCPEGGIVLDPFGGAGTTGLVATQNNRRALLLELNPDYAAMADKRIRESA